MKIITSLDYMKGLKEIDKNRKRAIKTKDALRYNDKQKRVSD